LPVCPVRRFIEHGYFLFLCIEASRIERRTVPVPGVAVPGVAVPGVAVPGVPVPGVAVPGVPVPGVPVPGVAVPGVPVPGVPVPGVAVPGVPVPGVAESSAIFSFVHDPQDFIPRYFTDNANPVGTAFCIGICIIHIP